MKELSDAACPQFENGGTIDDDYIVTASGIAIHRTLELLCLLRCFGDRAFRLNCSALLT
jgi:hypothetical protein